MLSNYQLFGGVSQVTTSDNSRNKVRYIEFIVLSAETSADVKTMSSTEKVLLFLYSWLFWGLQYDQENITTFNPCVA